MICRCDCMFGVAVKEECRNEARLAPHSESEVDLPPLKSRGQADGPRARRSLIESPQPRRPSGSEIPQACLSAPGPFVTNTFCTHFCIFTQTFSKHVSTTLSWIKYTFRNDECRREVPTMLVAEIGRGWVVHDMHTTEDGWSLSVFALAFTDSSPIADSPIHDVYIPAVLQQTMPMMFNMDPTRLLQNWVRELSSSPRSSPLGDPSSPLQCPAPRGHQAPASATIHRRLGPNSVRLGKVGSPSLWHRTCRDHPPIESNMDPSATRTSKPVQTNT